MGWFSKKEPVVKVAKAEELFNIGIIASNVMIKKNMHKMGLEKDVYKQMQKDMEERIKAILQRKLNENITRNGQPGNLSKIEQETMAEVS